MNKPQNTIFFFLIIFLGYVSAQSQSPLPSPYIFKPSLAIITGVFAVVFTLTFFLLVYVKCFYNNNLRQERDLEGDRARQDRLWQGLLNRSSSSRFSGLDKTSIESLPFFRFSSLKGPKQGLACSVCLSRFEDVEILRLLPQCKHAFHIGCIDTWLEKHATCPLCRNRVSVLDDDNTSVLVFSNNSFTRQEEPEEENSLEISIEREEGIISNGSPSSSRFKKILKIGGDKNEEETWFLDEQGNENLMMHRFNHKIVVSDLTFKNRWSSITPSDLTFLTSEMLDSSSSERFLMVDEVNEGNLCEKEDVKMKKNRRRRRRRRVMSEITAVPRLSVMHGTKENDSGLAATASTATTSGNEAVAAASTTEERRRMLWLPIAIRTMKWFVNREKTNELSNRTTSRQNLNV